MPTKMYILVETDKSQADPVSRLMTQLVDQLSQDSRKSRHPNDASSPAVPPTPQVLHPRSDDHSSPLHLRDVECRPTTKPIEITFSPDGKNVKTAITAETCIDSSGQAKAKVSVSTSQAVQEQSQSRAVPPPSCNETSNEARKECPPKVPYCELVQEQLCARRNGLDPTHAELRGLGKFEYVPLRSKIPDYDEKTRQASRPVDHSSNASSASRLAGCGPSRGAPVIAGLRQDCARNVPEARLGRYKACVGRKNGLQDKCDPVTRDALIKCCKAEK